MKQQKSAFNLIVLAATVLAVVIIFIAAKKPALSPEQSKFAELVLPFSSEKKVTLYYSSVDQIKYCNGDDMDSVGYGKTLDKKISFPLPESLKTPEEKFSYLMDVGASYVGGASSCPSAFLKDLQLKVKNNVAYLYNPGGGWAGFSIAMCACEPFLNKNLSGLFGVTKTSWDASQAEWDAIK